MPEKKEGRTIKVCPLFLIFDMKLKYLFFAAGVILLGLAGYLMYGTSMETPDSPMPPDVSSPSTPPVQQPSENQNPNIRITAPLSNQIIQSPLRVQGEAKGTWYFEASFPLKIVDANNVVLAQLPIQAKGDWMTTNFVPFDQGVEFKNPTASTGYVIFEKDNPSGLPENEDAVRIPVRFDSSTVLPKDMTLSIYFGNTKQIKPGQDECTMVFPVERSIPFTLGSAQAAMEELLKGPTASEKEKGYYTSINPNVKIHRITVENGVAKVDLDKKIEEAVGGSCRVTAIRTQIEKTLLQFPTVRSVVISVEGRTEDILQP